MSTPEASSVSLCPTPSHALLELSPSAALVHERGVIILANTAAARLLGVHSAESLIGRDLAAYLDGTPLGSGESLAEMRTQDGRRFPVWLHELPLVVGGRVRRTLMVRSIRPPLPAQPATACHAIERALAALDPLVRRLAHPIVALDALAQLHGDETLVERLTRALVLDALVALDGHAAATNRLAVFLVNEKAWVRLEVVADGVAAGASGGGVDSFGVELARRYALPLDAELRVDQPAAGQRRLVARWRRTGPP
jgi:hypothetical protein